MSRCWRAMNRRLHSILLSPRRLTTLLIVGSSIMCSCGGTDTGVPKGFGNSNISAACVEFCRVLCESAERCGEAMSGDCRTGCEFLQDQNDATEKTCNDLRTHVETAGCSFFL